MNEYFKLQKYLTFVEVESAKVGLEVKLLSWHLGISLVAVSHTAFVAQPAHVDSSSSQRYWLQWIKAYDIFYP